VRSGRRRPRSTAALPTPSVRGNRGSAPPLQQAHRPLPGPGCTSSSGHHKSRRVPLGSRRDPPCWPWSFRRRRQKPRQARWTPRPRSERWRPRLGLRSDRWCSRRCPRSDRWCSRRCPKIGSVASETVSEIGAVGEERNRCCGTRASPPFAPCRLGVAGGGACERLRIGLRIRRLAQSRGSSDNARAGGPGKAPGLSHHPPSPRRPWSARSGKYRLWT
jgi:hypothetical protein